MEITINIIPSDYEGDYTKTLGYCWADYATKTKGLDIVVEVTENGCDYVAAAKKAIEENGADSAYVNCMWCGGFTGTIEADKETTKTVKNISAPLTISEEAAQAVIIENADTKIDKNSHSGWCDKCGSYCYGDCESN